LTDADFIQSKLKDSMDTQSIEATKRSIERTEKEVADLNRRKGNILSAVEAGIGDLADYGAAMQKNKVETAEASNKIRILKTELKTISNSDVAAVEQAMFCDFAGFRTKPMIERKAILSKYVEKIVVTFPRGKDSDSFDLEFSVKAGLPATLQASEAVNKPGTPGNYNPSDDITALESYKYWLKSGVTNIETVSRTGSLLFLCARSRRSRDEPLLRALEEAR
jgi:hypothetical protein